MDEIIPGLWVGDLPSATDTATLKANKIFSILSTMRGRVTIHETFIRHQIQLDDTEETDVLIHFIPAITFIQAELDKGRGVLVHCQAGMSRSVTIVAAYLMYTQNIDTEAALNLIREARPNIDPNPGFLQQLQVFHAAAFKISRQNKPTRMFYLERAVEEVMNGDGSLPETAMFAKYPRTPSDSAPATPGGPRRRIRCKMCRQELATREHMLDHGQLGAATPVSSRHPSMNLGSRPKVESGSRPRRPSGLSDPSSLEVDGGDGSGNGDEPINGELSSLSMSTAVVDGNEDDSGTEDTDGSVPNTHPLAAATRLGRRLSNAMVASVADARSEEHPQATRISGLDDLAAQLSANSTIAALRGMTPLASPTSQPIIINPKCSGYFVEPMKWMESFLEEGQIAGKIVCPNSKCAAKLGNYDWAGMCCGCKEWVTPGFCINRSKVDEIV